ncbi:IS66 family insertion sequence element accessory protein TnpA [Alicyclobacillus hesperidum]|uniref:IS66 family insertion sequence element accessory protein TnpA n=1 Tax=Alicyclobacillus hesperidum TaxID=89784 RepID=UPI001ED950AE|nr:helix-turn-helix domain-containing protein [Alicyclobacillus hesperidum]
MEQHRELWRARVADFRVSGLTGAAWCAAHQVKEHQLWYWVGKFKADTDHEGRKRDSAEPRFIPVRVEESAPQATDKPLCVRVGPAVIEVLPGYDTDLLRDVVRTLASLC